MLKPEVARQPRWITTTPCTAVLFDMDGVITDTAGLHALAWKALFDELLLRRATPAQPFVPFDIDEDYRRYVDGRPRADGVSGFLGSRGISLPCAGPEYDTVGAVAARKNDLFLAAVAEHGVRSLPGAVRLIERLRLAGVRTALVTASSNANALLHQIGLSDLFDVVVDGLDAAEAGLPGKPDPAVFLEAARRLGVDPAQAAVVEDAEAGVAAGVAGGFGLVVGVDGDGSRGDALRHAGADLAVRDLDDPRLNGLLRPSDPSWVLRFEGVDLAQEGRREVLCATANGYLGVRAAWPEARADGVHYPGTYVSGFYNRLRSEVNGRTVEDEHLVRGPDVMALDAQFGVTDWTGDWSSEVQQHTQQIDLRTGILSRCLRRRDVSGRTTLVTQQRIVSMARPHLVVLRTTFLAEDWSGRLLVRSALDGEVENTNVDEYRLLATRHLLNVAADSVGPDVVCLEVETSTSHLRMACAARTRVFGATSLRRRLRTPGRAAIAQELEVELRQGEEVVVEKVIAVTTSRDDAMSSARTGALAELDRAGDADALVEAHAAAWDRLWDRFDLQVGTDVETRRALHLHMFHVLQTLSPHLVGIDAGVPARGLHGEGYRGHVFWDEAFVFPLLTLHLPALSRSLLLYRFRRLDAARDAARAEGRPGAMFPWQSGSDGRDETPSHLFNTRSGSWMPDQSRLQRHVGLAVAFSTWQYHQATGDLEFLTDHGAELLLEVGRYVCSLAVHDATTDRFSIDGVMGPDEYHDAMCGAAAPGLRDNAYTNVMTAWLLTKLPEVLDLVAAHAGGKTQERFRVHPDERARWDHVSRRLAVPFHADGVISQFDGYEQLEEFDWDGYRDRYGNIGRLDLILAAEGDTTNRFRLSKQADVLMLLYLLSAEELRAVLLRLGYALPPEAVRRTVAFYTARAARGSSLCDVVHAWILARDDRTSSWSTFTRALRTDLDDTQGGTTAQGIHLAAMAGTIDLLHRGYTGLELRDDTLWLNPRLPPEIERLSFSIAYRGHRITLDVDHLRVRLVLASGAAQAVQLDVCGNRRLGLAGETLEFALVGGA